jgi:hypothetical protein
MPSKQAASLCVAFCPAGRHALLASFIYGKWANIMHFLGCVLCLAFSVAWEQVRQIE